MEVEQAAGACLLIRKTFFDYVGGFSESFFPAWFEDIDFANKVLKNNRTSVIAPDARALHIGGCSLPSLGKLKFNIYYYRNMLRYVWKNLDAAEVALFVLLFVPVVVLRLVIALVEDGANYLFGKRSRAYQDTSKAVTTHALRG